MTESEWFACTDPRKMLSDLRAIAPLNDRKLRLFAVACCRGVWFWLEDEENVKALEAHERVADDLPVEIRGIHGGVPVRAALPRGAVAPVRASVSSAPYTVF